MIARRTDPGIPNVFTAEHQRRLREVERRRFAALTAILTFNRRVAEQCKLVCVPFEPAGFDKAQRTTTNNLTSVSPCLGGFITLDKQTMPTPTANETRRWRTANDARSTGYVWTITLFKGFGLQDHVSRNDIKQVFFPGYMIPLPLLYYYMFINIISFIMMLVDKRRAVRHDYRISEKALLLSGAAGGVIGMLLGMKLFRHKTRKRSFQVPLAGVVVLNVIYWYLMYVHL